MNYRQKVEEAIETMLDLLESGCFDDIGKDHNKAKAAQLSLQTVSAMLLSIAAETKVRDRAYARGDNDPDCLPIHMPKLSGRRK